MPRITLKDMEEEALGRLSGLFRNDIGLRIKDMITNQQHDGWDDAGTIAGWKTALQDRVDANDMVGAAVMATIVWNLEVGKGKS